MKRKILTGILSLTLPIAMLAGFFQLTAVRADTQNSEAAGFTNIQIVQNENYEGAAYWVIELTADQNIGFGDNSYWYRNLQQISSGATDEHNAFAEIINKNILFNGKTIGDGLKESSDSSTSVRVKIGCTSNGGTQNKLWIAVTSEFTGQSDNVFGVNDYKNFTLEFKKGITFNGHSVKPVKYKYRAASGAFTIDDGTAAINDITFKYDDKYEGGASFLLILHSEDEIGLGDGSYWYKNLQLKDPEAGKEHNELAAALQSGIVINGKTVGQGLEAAADKKSSTRIIAGNTASGTQNQLLIAVKASDNPYKIGTDTAFTFEIKTGIYLNGATLSAGKYRYSSATGRVLEDDGSKEFTNALAVKKDKFDNNDQKPCYLFTFQSEGEIGFGNNSYWDRNLQQINSSAGEEHNARAKELRSKILINGITVDAGLNAASDKACSTHLQIGCKADKTQNYFYIAVRIDDNPYGISLDSDFTIEFKQGILLNNIKVAAGVYCYNAATGKFTVEGGGQDNTTVPDGTHLQRAAVNSSASGVCTNNGHAFDSYVVDLTFDKDISAKQANSYYDRHLQVCTDQALRTAIRNKIRLNGKTVDECLTIAGGDAHTAIHIKADKNVLSICVPKNNTYGFNGNGDFTITINSGITLNGTALAGVAAAYDAASKQFKIEENTNQPVAGNVTGVTLKKQNDKSWIISMIIDKDITVSGGVAADLQFAERQKTKERKELAEQIINKITINGESLIESIERVNNHYTARVSASGNELQLKMNIKTLTTIDNDFHISDKESFTVCIRDTLEISKVSIAPIRYAYNGETGVFTVDNSEDVKNIAPAKMYITGSSIGENGKGIYMWATGTSRVVHLMLDGKLKGVSHNAEALPTLHGEQCRNYIYIDGMSISEWIGYGEGDLYQVMVRFKENYIEFLFDGSREPGMVEDEVHWLEIKDGLYTSAGEKIVPQKLFFNPKTGFWEKVNEFEGLEKPWFLKNFENLTEMAEKGQGNDDSYKQAQPDWDEAMISKALLEAQEKAEEESNTIIDDKDTTTDTGITEEDNETTEQKKVAVKVRKKVNGDVTYEFYFPVWGTVLICVGAVLLIAGTIVIIILYKRKKRL